MTNLTFHQIQVLELRRLLASAKDDPILAPQLEERLADLEKEGKSEAGTLFPKEPPVLPRAAIFLRGGGVVESEGIRAALAGDALVQYERMFTAQAIHDERETAKTAGRQRRPRGTPTPGLLFIGTPRGSFGLEFVPQPTEDAALLDVHAKALGNVADAIVRVVESDSRGLDEAIKTIPSAVLQPLKRFMKTLAGYGAELRLALHDRGLKPLGASLIQEASERLEKQMIQETITVEGIFRGVTLESGHFDLKVGAEIISGVVADDLIEEDLQRIDKLTDKACKATLQKITVRNVAGTSTTTYVLSNLNGE